MTHSIHLDIFIRTVTVRVIACCALASVVHPFTKLLLNDQALSQEPATTVASPFKVDSTFDGETIDSWHGFKRHKFTFDGAEAWVVEPETPRADGRFSWCMMFPDAFTQRCAAPMLVSRGYYHVFLSVGNSFGAPQAIEKLDAFHQMLVRRGFHPQPVLIGISRGGLYAHRYAATHPDRVSVIYNDAPVLDYQSWPGGKGKGKGSQGDWQELKRWYGFNSDQQAAEYPQTPLKEPTRTGIARRRISTEALLCNQT